MGAKKMVVVSSHSEYYINSIAYYFWRFISRNTICIFYILMKFIKIYHQIWLQCTAFMIISIVKHNPVFVYLAGILFLLVVLLPSYAVKYISFLEFIFNKTGYWLKSILFFFLFYVLFLSVSILMRIINKKKEVYYTERNKSFTTIDFEKMW